MIVCRLKRRRKLSWSFFINKPQVFVTSGLTWVCTLILETEVSLLKGTDPGQTGCHRHLVYLWKMINLTFYVFWVYLQPCGSLLIFLNFTNLCEFRRIFANKSNFYEFQEIRLRIFSKEIRRNSPKFAWQLWI